MRLMNLSYFINSPAAFFKIFINYSQMLAIINGLNLNWNEIFLNFFDAYKPISGSVHQILSFECIFSGN